MVLPLLIVLTVLYELHSPWLLAPLDAPVRQSIRVCGHSMLPCVH